MKEFTEIEEHNGFYAVQCLESEKARAAYDAGGVKVYEYANPERPASYERLLLYAYQYRDQYAEDLTEKELAEALEAIGEKEGERK